jgi:hypothetical protein
VRQGRTSIERIHAVQDAGLDVWCGMILGFDNDDVSIFAAQREYLNEARILHAMVGMLSAIPKTPLHARLAAEGRLDEEHEAEFGTNVIPARMSRDELRDGYLQLMHDLYEPAAYFDRLDDLFLRGNFRFSQTRAAYWRRHPVAWIKGNATHSVRSVAMYLQLMRGVPEANLRFEYRRRIRNLLRTRRDPVVLFVYLIKCAIHYHVHTMVENMSAHQDCIVNTF